jgi:hypothetical protein
MYICLSARTLGAAPPARPFNPASPESSPEEDPDDPELLPFVAVGAAAKGFEVSSPALIVAPAPRPVAVANGLKSSEVKSGTLKLSVKSGALKVSVKLKSVRLKPPPVAPVAPTTVGVVPPERAAEGIPLPAHPLLKSENEVDRG